MDETKEKLIDKILLDEIEIDKYLKVSTSLLFVMHRQLVTLAKHTGTPVEKMTREFILEHIANVKISDSVREKVKSSLHAQIGKTDD